MPRWTVIAGLLLAACSSGSLESHATDESAALRCAPPAEDALPFPEAKLYFEHNSTDGDTGLHGLLDASGWSELCVYDPRGEQILAVRPLDSLAELGLASLFFESREPKHSEVSVEQHLRTFPAGRYEIRGLSHDGRPLTGTATLTHDIPAGAVILSPGDEAVVPASGLVVSWEPVTRSIGAGAVEVSGYEVIVTHAEAEDPHGFAKPIFDVHVPPSVTSLTVSDEFLEPGTPYEIEVLTLEASGNQTISALVFQTEGAETDGGNEKDGANAGSASCPDDPKPPGAENCPDVCSGGCDENNVCTIDCRGNKACEAATLDCPQDYACVVVCDGLDACDTNTINCPTDYACTLVCEQKDGCGDLIFNCGAASCSIECGAHPSSCEGAVVVCGTGACNASCEASSGPHLSDCEKSCACLGC